MASGLPSPFGETTNMAAHVSNKYVQVIVTDRSKEFQLKILIGLVIDVNWLHIYL